MALNPWDELGLLPLMCVIYIFLARAQLRTSKVTNHEERTAVAWSFRFVIWGYRPRNICSKWGLHKAIRRCLPEVDVSHRISATHQTLWPRGSSRLPSGRLSVRVRKLSLLARREQKVVRSLIKAVYDSDTIALLWKREVGDSLALCCYTPANEIRAFRDIGRHIARGDQP